MIKLAIVSASAVVVMICVTIWVSQQIAGVPASETAPQQADMTSGRDMRPRWVAPGGQGNGASN